MEAEIRAYTIQSHGVKLARTHLHDWILLVILVVIEVVLNIIDPFYPFVGKDMMTDLKYPFKPILFMYGVFLFLSIAEETLAEFLSKATETAVDWVQMPGMKPGPHSVGIFAISQRCSGVAARARGLVSLEPSKMAEILKDRPSWFRDCRSL